MVMFLRTLGMLWVLPVAAPVWLLYLLPAWWLGYIRFDGFARFGVVRFRVSAPPEHWYGKLWQRWGGFAAPYAVLLNTEHVAVELHELRHTDQWLLLGPLFPVVYLILLAAEGYREHSLEEDARDWARKQWVAASRAEVRR